MKAEAQAAADGLKLKVQAEKQAMEDRSQMAAAYAQHPELLRLEELATLRELGANANARLYLNLDRNAIQAIAGK